MAIIYKITNDINGKMYVGKTLFDAEKRFQEHCADSKKRKMENRPLYSAMRKYGTEHFHMEIIEETDNPVEREKYWIEKLGTYGNGNYNATRGGDGKQIYDHKEILELLYECPYPILVAKEIGCCVDLVKTIAKANNIHIRSASRDGLSGPINKKKPVIAYSKDGVEVKRFESTVEAAKWCVENKLALALNNGVRGKISLAANGKVKTAYKHIWKYVE